MTLNRGLENAARDAGVLLAGSLIAAPRARRRAVARELVGCGHWAHADVIGGSYRGQEGVALEDLGPLAEEAGPRLDVHLMVDDLAAAIGALPPGTGRVTIQCPSAGGLAGHVARARRRAREVWASIDTRSAGQAEQALHSGADGIVVMLTPPGQPGHRADPSRLEDARARIPGRFPLGADGGVTLPLIARLRQAGVVYAVAGRALLAHPMAQDRHALEGTP